MNTWLSKLFSVFHRSDQASERIAAALEDIAVTLEIARDVLKARIGTDAGHAVKDARAGKPIRSLVVPANGNGSSKSATGKQAAVKGRA
jgi:hypothetical protein